MYNCIFTLERVISLRAYLVILLFCCCNFSIFVSVFLCSYGEFFALFLPPTYLEGNSEGVVGSNNLIMWSIKKNHSMWFGDGWKIFSNIFPSASFQHCCSPLVLSAVTYFLFHQLVHSLSFVCNHVFPGLMKNHFHMKIIGNTMKTLCFQLGASRTGQR